MLKQILFSFIFLFFSVLCVSQSTTQAIENGQDPNVLYRNEMSGNVFIHSRGLGIGFMRAKHVTGTRKRLFEIQALNLKHPKEIKVSTNPDNSKRFVYGKLKKDKIGRLIKKSLLIYKCHLISQECS